MSTSKQWAIGVLAGLMAGAAAVSQTEIRHESSAVTYDEVTALQQRAGDYSFKLMTAAKGSGAWLTDVDVTIRSMPGREVVLEERTQGPLLLADLPPGRYEISATCSAACAGERAGAAMTQKRVVTVPRSGHAQSVLYFDTGD